MSTDETTSPRFGATSTAAEVVSGIDLSDRRVIVTAGSSGIGLETARALASVGAQVIIAVRDVDAGATACRDINLTAGDAPATARTLDLADPSSISTFLAGWAGPLHVLVNNAGVMKTPERYTNAGWELQFATNHLGHFALTLGLHDALAEAKEARVVAVSSSGHGSSPVVFDDLFFRRRPYDADQAYGQSKTANVLFAVEANRRWLQDGITVNAVMPGGVWTKLQRHWDPGDLAQAKAASENQTKSAHQGAATSVLVATAPSLAGVGGRYFEDCREAEQVATITDGLHGVREFALDPTAASRLWDVSLALIDADSAAERRAQTTLPKTN